MDPLSASEYGAALEALRAVGLVDDGTRYPLITLDEPEKAEVWAWRPGTAAPRAIPRSARITVKKGPRTFEARVDLARRAVLTWTEVEGVQPTIFAGEGARAVRLTQADPGWRAAMAKRGLTRTEDVVCTPLSVGNFGRAEAVTRRLLKVVCFDARGSRNYWARPIEGVVAVVDLDGNRVTRVTDSGVRPIPEPAELDPESVGPLRPAAKPVASAGIKGTNFTTDGHVVSWQNWRFHVKLDPRLGPVISTVRYRDGGELRPVLYQGSLSELFVPYMDPDAAWYFRTYLDAGEFNLGISAVPLKPGIDCPEGARFMNAVFASPSGQPFGRARAACVFERDLGDVAWRHLDWLCGTDEARKSSELVVRFVAAVANYDYVFDWRFGLDGGIMVAVGATGVEQVRAVDSKTAGQPGHSGDTRTGTLVAPHTLAVNHSHFFAFRLDLDVDGPRNSFGVDRLVSKRLDDGGPRKSIWVVEQTRPASEAEARLQIDWARPALWRVFSAARSNALGYPTSFELVPGVNSVPLLTPEDAPRRRAGFIDHHLWVTPYSSDERYAAGAYPNQSRGNDGLPAWSAADRPIEDRDIVLWYTLGLQHFVRAEDWPVLPLVWRSFQLRPFNFFDRNPALDLPASPSR